MRYKIFLPTILTLLGLAIVYTLGLTFVTVEAERLVERTLTPLIRQNPEAARINRSIANDLEGFMTEKHIRPIGYACLGIVVALTIAGLILEKKGLASLGGVALFLPTYAYFAIHMSMFAGLGILKALWLPFWGRLVKLGDIAYLPYILAVYPLAQVGVDARRFLAELSTKLGLLIFVLGVLAWFYARYQKKVTADFWIYRFSRHPQYLGWILWSYGLMLLAAQRSDIPLGDTNPGGSLPWLFSTLVIVCVALSEEINMQRVQGDAYKAYQARAPLMFPLPKRLVTLITAPLRMCINKDRPENRGELLLTFFIYAVILLLLSLPFALLDWPPNGGWMNWPEGI